MYGYVYSSVVESISVTAVQDFLEITAPADAVVVIHSVRIGGESPDAGDAEAEILPIRLTKYATGGSGGTLNIARTAHVNGAPASASVVDRNNTTQGGTPIVQISDSWNVQAGWLYLPTPEERIVLGASEILAIELPVAPADAILMSGTITFEEIGGF